MKRISWLAVAALLISSAFLQTALAATTPTPAAAPKEEESAELGARGLGGGIGGTGAGGVGGAVGGVAGSLAGGLIAKQIGGALGSAGGPIGSLLGAGIGSLLGGLFSGKKLLAAILKSPEFCRSPKSVELNAAIYCCDPEPLKSITASDGFSPTVLEIVPTIPC